MKTMMYGLAALVAVGMVSTSFARTDNFIDFKEPRQQIQAQEEELERSPAQAAEDKAAREDAQRRRVERFLNRL